MNLLTTLLLVLVISFATVGLLTDIYSAPLPKLEEGDIVLQTGTGFNDISVVAATDSKYTHVGIVRWATTGLMVIEAADTVQEIPLDDWVKKGLMHRFAVYRFRDLNPKTADKVIESAKKYEGRKFDYALNFKNKRIYGSELAYLSFREAGLDVGHVQKIRELNIENPFVKNLVSKIAEGDSECKKITAFECIGVIRDRAVVTPASIAKDVNLKLVYSNYLF